MAQRNPRPDRGGGDEQQHGPGSPAGRKRGPTDAPADGLLDDPTREKSPKPSRDASPSGRLLSAPKATSKPSRLGAAPLLMFAAPTDDGGNDGGSGSGGSEDGGSGSAPAAVGGIGGATPGSIVPLPALLPDHELGVGQPVPLVDESILHRSSGPFVSLVLTSDLEAQLAAGSAAVPAAAQQGGQQQEQGEQQQGEQQPEPPQSLALPEATETLADLEAALLRARDEGVPLQLPCPLVLEDAPQRSQDLAAAIAAKLDQAVTLPAPDAEDQQEGGWRRPISSLTFAALVRHCMARKRKLRAAVTCGASAVFELLTVMASSLGRSVCGLRSVLGAEAPLVEKVLEGGEAGSSAWALALRDGGDLACLAAAELSFTPAAAARLPPAVLASGTGTVDEQMQQMRAALGSNAPEGGETASLPRVVHCVTGCSDRVAISLAPAASGASAVEGPTSAASALQRLPARLQLLAGLLPLEAAPQKPQQRAPNAKPQLHKKKSWVRLRQRQQQPEEQQERKRRSHHRPQPLNRDQQQLVDLVVLRLGLDVILAMQLTAKVAEAQQHVAPDFTHLPVPVTVRMEGGRAVAMPWVRVVLSGGALVVPLPPMLVEVFALMLGVKRPQEATAAIAVLGMRTVDGGDEDPPAAAADDLAAGGEPRVTAAVEDEGEA